MRNWESLRHDARRLEQDLEERLSGFSKLYQNLNGDLNGEEGRGMYCREDGGGGWRWERGLILGKARKESERILRVKVVEFFFWCSSCFFYFYGVLCSPVLSFGGFFFGGGVRDGMWMKGKQVSHSMVQSNVEEIESLLVQLSTVVDAMESHVSTSPSAIHIYRSHADILEETRADFKKIQVMNLKLASAYLHRRTSFSPLAFLVCLFGFPRRASLFLVERHCSLSVVVDSRHVVVTPCFVWINISVKDTRSE